MKTINVTTKELYDNFMASVEDIIWEAGYVESHVREINRVASKKMEDIRQMFKDGYTMMMLGKKIEEIEKWDDVNKKVVTEPDEIEIRVYGLNQTTGEYTTRLGVIIDSEINY